MREQILDLHVNPSDETIRLGPLAVHFLITGEDSSGSVAAFAIEHGSPGLYNIVDDDPAEVAVWLPELARAIGAKPPYHIPAWLGRLVIGDAGYP